MNRREMLQAVVASPMVACGGGSPKSLEEFERRLKELLGIEDCSAFEFSYSHTGEDKTLAIGFGFEDPDSAEKIERAKRVQAEWFAEAAQRGEFVRRDPAVRYRMLDGTEG